MLNSCSSSNGALPLASAEPPEVTPPASTLTRNSSAGPPEPQPQRRAKGALDRAHKSVSPLGEAPRGAPRSGCV